MSRIKEFIVITMSPVGNGLSGGDRIFVELTRFFNKKHIHITYVTWRDGKKMLDKQEFSKKNISYSVLSIGLFAHLGFTICYGARILRSILWSLTIQLPKAKQNEQTCIYCASDFWMDSLPCLIMKIRYSKIRWVGTLYLSAPNPFIGFREKGKFQMPSRNGILYFLMQQPIYLIMKYIADYMFVTSLPDAKKFPKHEKTGKVYIVQGGVRLDHIRNWQKKHAGLVKKYDAVFMGRLHPQKGVLDLIDIWRLVVLKKKHATLIIIGDGPLEEEIKTRIKKYNLEKNVLMKGYVFDGDEKYTLFTESKIFLHPVIYDSGGMAAAEGMAWEMPAVSFDLEALKTYYPKGVVKVPIGNKKAFAQAIITLLGNKQKYTTIQKQGTELIETIWDWDKRSSRVLQFLEK